MARRKVRDPATIAAPSAGALSGALSDDPADYPPPQWVPAPAGHAAWSLHVAACLVRGFDPYRVHSALRTRAELPGLFAAREDQS